MSIDNLYQAGWILHEEYWEPRFRAARRNDPDAFTYVWKGQREVGRYIDRLLSWRRRADSYTAQLISDIDLALFRPLTQYEIHSYKGFRIEWDNLGWKPRQWR